MAEELTEKTTEEYDAEIDEMFRRLKGETVDIFLKKKRIITHDFIIYDYKTLLMGKQKIILEAL